MTANELIEAREAAGFDEPLMHYQGTMTGARYDDLIPWDQWYIVEDGYYSGKLTDLYAVLGIVPGNGEWYESAWRYDWIIDQETADAWEEFVNESLAWIDPADYWVWEEEEGQ